MTKMKDQYYYYSKTLIKYRNCILISIKKVKINFLYFLNFSRVSAY